MPHSQLHIPPLCVWCSILYLKHSSLLSPPDSYFQLSTWHLLGGFLPTLLSSPLLCSPFLSDLLLFFPSPPLCFPSLLSLPSLPFLLSLFFSLLLHLSWCWRLNSQGSTHLVKCSVNELHPWIYIHFKYLFIYFKAGAQYVIAQEASNSLWSPGCPWTFNPPAFVYPVNDVPRLWGLGHGYLWKVLSSLPHTSHLLYPKLNSWFFNIIHLEKDIKYPGLPSPHTCSMICHSLW